MKNETECPNPWLCFILGFFLPLIGLIVSAIIGKGTGVKHAIAGIALRCILCIAGCLFIGGAITQAVNETNKASIRHRAGRDSEKPNERVTWRVTKKQSPIDDSYTVVISRDAEAPVSSGFKKERPTLIMRKQEGKREVYILFPMYLGSSKIPVTVRFGSNEAITEDWGTSSSGKAVFSPFPFEDFFAMVKSSNKLVVRLTPFGENPETVVFGLEGLDDMLKDSVVSEAFEK